MILFSCFLWFEVWGLDPSSRHLWANWGRVSWPRQPGSRRYRLVERHCAAQLGTTREPPNWLVYCYKIGYKWLKKGSSLSKLSKAAKLGQSCLLKRQVLHSAAQKVNVVRTKDRPRTDQGPTKSLKSLPWHGPWPTHIYHTIPAGGWPSLADHPSSGFRNAIMLHHENGFTGIHTT